MPAQVPSTTILKVYFQGVPARTNHLQEVLGDLPSDHLPALEDYALYTMASADGQPKRALDLWASFEKRQKALAYAVDHRLTGTRPGRLGGLAERI